MTTKAKPVPRAFDPRSAAPTLAYSGSGSIRGIPARDLSDADLARAAWEAADPRPASVLDVTDAAIAFIRDELIATGIYQEA